MTKFLPISTARFVENGTIADLQMGGGVVVRAVWEERGRATAWWPCLGERLSRPLGLYDPVGWCPINKPVPSADVIVLPVIKIERHDGDDGGVA